MTLGMKLLKLQTDGKGLLETILKYTACGEQIAETKEDENSIAQTDIDIDHKGGPIVNVKSIYKDYIPMFLEDIHNDIKTMMEALKNGDYEVIRNIGHSTKGSGGGYGFYVITDIGKSIEDGAKEKDPDEIQKWLDELLNYIETVEVIYE